MAYVQDQNKERRKYFIESSCLFTNQEVADPLSKFKISSCDFLDELPERSCCPKCYKSRRYYCYNCYLPIDEIKERIPMIKLPLKVDIIKHPREVDGKSTSAHAAILAPEHVKIYVYPDFPDYQKEKVILIFPGKNAQTLHNFLHNKMYTECNQRYKEDITLSQKSDHVNNLNYSSYDLDTSSLQTFSDSLPFEKVVFIDSTWKQTKRIYGDERIRALPCVLLTSHKSLFWRHQRDKPVNFLATIEAIYYFMVELYGIIYPDKLYTGEYDDLLFFFKFMYNKIRTLYDPATLKAYQQ